MPHLTLFRLSPRHSEHLLRFLSAELVDLSAGVLDFGYPAKFVLRVLNPEMSVRVQRNPDVAVPHKILQRFRVHAGLCHVAAIGVTADVRGDTRHLQPLDEKCNLCDRYETLMQPFATCIKICVCSQLQTAQQCGLFDFYGILTVDKTVTVYRS